MDCRVDLHWSWVDRTGEIVKQSQRRVTSPASKMFRQHVAWLHQDVQEDASDFFFCFFLLSQLSEPGRLGRALSGPASRLASAMTFSGCDTLPMVDCCSLSICRTQSPEELGRVGDSVWMNCQAVVRRHWLFFFFFFFNANAEERTRREGRQNFPLASQ